MKLFETLSNMEFDNRRECKHVCAGSADLFYSSVKMLVKSKKNIP